MKYGAFVLLFIVCISLVAPAQYAHGDTVYGNLNDVSVAVYPENPQADSNVSLEIQSFLINLTSADISWSIDGKKVQSGIGLKVFKFTTKDVGMPTTIDIAVLPVGGYLINKELVITPSAVDILWEATDSVTPPFYKGKALPTSQAQLKFVAIPNIKTSDGTFVDSKDIIYTWSKDYTVDQNGSGYAKDSYSMEMPIVDQEENISVTAKMRDGGLSAFKQVTSSVFQPKIVWYLTSPLYGPQFERAITDGFSIGSNDVSIFAEPFFASPANVLSGDLSFTWRLNNDSLDAQSPANVLSLHRNSDNVGDATIGLTIENSKKYLQELKSTLTLHLE